GIRDLTVTGVQTCALPILDRANSGSGGYDQYGQEMRQGGATAAGSSPIYLFAFQDHTIRAAASYWVDGQTLHYVTLQHEEKQGRSEERRVGKECQQGG